MVKGEGRWWGKSDMPAVQGMDRFGRGWVVYISRCRGNARGLAALRVVLSRRKFVLLPQ